MINTVADFLHRLQTEHENIAEAKGIKHRVTIGEMYENITAGLLKLALFDEINLNIISQSFVVDGKGNRSQEMDIMIIEGEGRPIEFTNRFDVDFDQVVAVIQVKKTLNYQQLEEGYLNLYSVYEIAPEEIQQYQINMFNDMYRSICRESPAVNGKIRKEFTTGTSEALYEVLKWEAIMPARILFAFTGYRSEKSLRDSFYNFLGQHRSESEKPIPGFGPLNFPNLIVNDDYMLTKNNGMPFVMPLKGSDWDFYTSSRGNPFLALLEIVWSRLSYRYKLSAAIFGEDLKLAGGNKYLTANPVWINGFRGWNYQYTAYVKKELEKQVIEQRDWAPVQLTREQHFIVVHLCKYEAIGLHKLKRIIQSIVDISEIEIDKFLTDLVATDLVYIYNKRELRLLTKRCRTIITPDGKYYAADDKTGRLSRWSERFFKT